MAEFEVPRGRAAGRIARCLVAERLGAVSQDGISTAMLLVDELVTNAVEHGEGTITVIMQLDPELLNVSVSDQGPNLPELMDPDERDDHGRGLQLVNGLADAWGVRLQAGGGKSVWFDLGLHASHAAGAGSDRGAKPIQSSRHSS